MANAGGLLSALIGTQLSIQPHQRYQYTTGMDKNPARKHLAQQSTPGRLRQLGRYKPEYHIGFRQKSGTAQEKAWHLPIRKFWPVIIILACVCVGLFVPLLNLPVDVSGADNLFDFTTSLFMVFWGLGWAAGILMVLAVLLALLFARETVIVSPELLLVRLAIFGFGLEARYPLSRLSQLRYVEASPDKGSRWRGAHLAVDYLQVPIRFGSHLDRKRAGRLLREINAALAYPVPDTLPPDTLAAARAETGASMVAAPQENTTARDETVSDKSIQSTGRTSLWLLMGANLVPLLGVLFLDWRVGDIMLLFWLESAIVGFFNILKMFRIAGPAAIFYSLFFIGHFGAFMAVHLMFVFSLFLEEPGQSASLTEVGAVFRNLWPAIVALVISHGFSYVDNFLGRQEYLTRKIGEQMHQPYSRIITMHVTLIIGGFMVLALNTPVLALCLLIVLKTAADGRAHVKAHRPVRDT